MVCRLAVFKSRRHRNTTQFVFGCGGRLFIGTNTISRQRFTRHRIDLAYGDATDSVGLLFIGINGKAELVGGLVARPLWF